MRRALPSLALSSLLTTCASPPAPTQVDSGLTQVDSGLTQVDSGLTQVDSGLTQVDSALTDSALTQVDSAGVGQGPVAEGEIVYSQDFEEGQEGITLSPTNLPASRAMRVDDPLGRRGKVMRVQYLPGDDFRIGQFKPRANISNTGFHYGPGETVSYAWGYMTSTTYIGATLAQNIAGGDPIWMIQGRDNGEMDMVPGLKRLPVRLEANRWHDFRAEVHYVAGAAGYILLFLDGVKVFEHHGGLPVRAGAHWDGGIYITGFGEPSNAMRTVYISNLSVGKK
jgi:X-X-X-Leu-X-X-Gly heptad repeat protein